MRGLGRLNAENVARHLVMVQRLVDEDPELAYQHARYACSHAGRVAVVREAAAIAGYLAGHYQDALRDLRAARRLSGVDLHRAIEADCERALGHLGRALKAAEGADPSLLDDVEEAEIAMVVSGVRHEMGQTELGLLVIEEAIMMFRGDKETLRRLHSVRADRLEELGREEEARQVRERIGEAPEPEVGVEVFDLEEEAEAQVSADGVEEAPVDATQAPPSAGTHTVSDSLEEVSAAASSSEPQHQAVPAQEEAEQDAGDVDRPEDEDTSWEGDFAARVAEELSEVLREAGIPQDAGLEGAEDEIVPSSSDEPVEGTQAQDTAGEERA